MGLNDWRDWERKGFWTRSAAIARELGRHPQTNQLIIVGDSSSVAVRIAKRAKHLLNKPPGQPILSTAWFSVYRVASKILLIVPTRLLPREEKFAFAYHINRLVHDRSTSDFIRAIVAQVGDAYPTILWIANPLKAYWLGRLGEENSIFDSIEDLRHHPDKRHIAGLVDRGYRLAGERAKTIFAVSQPMVDLLSSGRPDRPAILAPNGLDSALFKNSDYRNSLAAIARPIAGYAGTLQERIDVDLLERLAVEAPDISQVFIGPVTAPRHFARLKRYPNVHFLGVRPHHKIPGYLSSFNVCLLPHKVNKLTDSMDPLKVYEYVAAGKRVVASCPVAIKALDQAITVAQNDRDFITEVKKQAVSQPDDTIAALRDYVLSKLDWRSIVDRMLAVVLSEGKI